MQSITQHSAVFKFKALNMLLSDGQHGHICKSAALALDLGLIASLHLLHMWTSSFGLLVRPQLHVSECAPSGKLATQHQTNFQTGLALQAIIHMWQGCYKSWKHRFAGSLIACWHLQVSWPKTTGSMRLCASQMPLRLCWQLTEAKLQPPSQPQR